MLYPHLKSHPNYDVAIKQIKTGGGMITFFLKGGLKESRQFLENFHINDYYSQISERTSDLLKGTFRIFNCE